MSTTYFRLMLKAQGKGRFYISADGRIVTSTSASGEMQFASIEDATKAIALIRQNIQAVKDWEINIEDHNPDYVPVVTPGTYHEGNTIYKVTICDECGSPRRTLITECLSSSTKPKLYHELPEGVMFCDCVGEDDDETEEEENEEA